MNPITLINLYFQAYRQYDLGLLSEKAYKSLIKEYLKYIKKNFDIIELMMFDSMLDGLGCIIKTHKANK